MIKLKSELAPLSHGGNLHRAIAKYQIPADQWLDLSTGISPWSYPIPELPESVWNQLPAPLNDMLEAAANYYQTQTDNLVATPGSQIPIRLLPHFFKASTIAIPAIGYQEHKLSWALAGHHVQLYHSITELFELAESNKVEHIVVINPNNPTGELFERAQLEQLLSLITGQLIVDEAFMDICQNTQQTTMVNSDSDRVVVFKSVGKFFGLAGLRVGFVACHKSLAEQLNLMLQPWSISYASQTIAALALNDAAWQQQQRDRIAEQSTRFIKLLKPALEHLINEHKLQSRSLFTTVFAEQACIENLHHRLAEQGVWTRLFNKDDPQVWLRFSLPKSVSEFESRISKLL